MKSRQLTVEELESRRTPSAATAFVASGVIHSAENLTNFVATEYQQLLRRAPDAAGLSGWVQATEKGLSFETVEAEFVASAEYFQKHGSDHTAWVTGLYNDLLGRAPDAAGLMGWVNFLNAGGSRLAVAQGIASSAERDAILINEDFGAFLHRPPSQAEVSALLAGLRQGGQRADVAVGLLASTEFFQDQLSDPSRFIAATYQDVLHRTPGPAEIAMWQTAFDAPNTIAMTGTDGIVIISQGFGP